MEWDGRKGHILRMAPEDFGSSWNCNRSRASNFKQYSPGQLERIVNALRWVKQNPVDFAEVMPGLKLEDATIRVYLEKLRRILESMEQTKRP